MADDFTLPSGQVVAVNLNNFQEVHNNFAMQCKYTATIIEFDLTVNNYRDANGQRASWHWSRAVYERIWSNS